MAGPLASPISENYHTTMEDCVIALRHNGAVGSLHLLAKSTFSIKNPWILQDYTAHA